MDDSVNELGEDWNCIIEYKEGNENVNEAQLDMAIAAVSNKIAKHGLPSSCMETLISILEKIKSDDDLCFSILQIMIPNEPLSDQSVIRLIMWFQSKYSKKGNDGHYFTYWFLVCLKIGLINKQVVQNHFNSLMFLFLQNMYDDALSHILVYVAKENKITTTFFNQLIHKYKRLSDPKKKSHMSVLINYCIKLLPQYTTSQTEFDLKKIVKPHVLTLKDKIFNRKLNRIILLNTSKEEKLDSSKIFKDVIEAQDEDCYFGLTPVYDETVTGPRLTLLKKEEDVIKHYDKIILPKNMLAVLQCKSAPLYIRLLNKVKLDELEEQISCILTGILDSKFHPAIQNDKFLKSLQLVQSKGHESLISVSNFLKKYFIIWDGLKYRSEIIGLIPWLQFDSHEDMLETMKALLNVYTTVDLDCRVQIIGGLADLYVKMMCVINTRVRHDHSCRNDLPAWMRTDAENVLKYYLSIFDNFVSIGLTHHKNGSAFLVATLTAFIKIFVCQDTYNFRVLEDVYSCYHFTLIPVSLVLMSHSSFSLTVLDLLVQILSLYWDSIPKIDSGLTEEYYQEFKSNLNTIEVYSKDTLKLLFDGIDSEELDEMMVGSLLKDSCKREFEAVKGFPSHIKHFLSITSHFATSHIIHALATKMKINVSTIRPTKYFDILDHIAPKMSMNLKKITNQVEASKTNREQISDDE